MTTKDLIDRGIIILLCVLVVGCNSTDRFINKYRGDYSGDCSTWCKSVQCHATTGYMGEQIITCKGQDFVDRCLEDCPNNFRYIRNYCLSKY